MWVLQNAEVKVLKLATQNAETAGDFCLMHLRSGTEVSSVEFILRLNAPVFSLGEKDVQKNPSVM